MFPILKSYKFQPVEIPSSFNTFFQSKLALSKQEGVRKYNEERLIRHSSGKSEIAILYIHGFGASRGEGEAVMDRIARQYRANIYYLRLPGHGTTPEDQARHDYTEYLQTAEEALSMMHLLGDRCIVAGTSMGGLIASYLAACNPHRIDALILASPFYEFVNRWGGLTLFPGGVELINLFMGKWRHSASEKDPAESNIRLPGYDDRWYPDQLYAAIRPLARLRHFAVRHSVLGRISVPTLLMYYYRDDNNQDHSAEVKSMVSWFQLFGFITGRDAHNRLVSIPDANHVMMSNYVRSNLGRVESEITDFLDPLVRSWKPAKESRNSRRTVGKKVTAG